MDVKSDTSSLSCSSSSSSSSLSPLSSSYSHCAYCCKRFSALQKRINCSENNRILINEIGIPHPYRNSKLIHTKCEVAIRLNLLQGQSSPHSQPPHSSSIDNPFNLRRRPAPINKLLEKVNPPTSVSESKCFSSGISLLHINSYGAFCSDSCKDTFLFMSNQYCKNYQPFSQS